MRSACGTVWLLLAACLLAACSPSAVRPDRQLLAAQGAREHKLATLDSWTVHARLAVSNGTDGGSGSLVWVHKPGAYDFVLQAPVTGRSFRLRGDAGQVRLEGLDRGPLEGGDARTLLRQALGWQVPMEQLDYWVRGMRAPGSPAQLLFGANGLPARLVQDGWNVEYRDWYGDTRPPLPRRVFASRDKDHVKLVINSWSLH